MMERYRLVQELVQKDLFLYSLDNYGRDYANALIGFVSKEHREILESCQYNRDTRTIEEYAQTIILEWIIEDHVQKLLQENGYDVQLSGADKKREFLKNSKVKGTSDFIINGKRAELIVDYCSYWRDLKVMHFRDYKFQNIQKERAIILALDIVDKKLGIITAEEITNAKWIHHKFWNKKAIEVPIDTSTFIPFSNSVISLKNPSY